MAWLSVVAASVAALVINEVLFDPPGTDAGHEFVEFFNPGPSPVDLDGLELHFLNGADPDPGDVVWRGDPAVLGAGEFFVVGGDQVGGRDRTATLGLQNGDEALVLLREGQPVDAVAWGEDLGLGEGLPAAGGAGTSIGRVPDGADSDDNRADFRELPRPTPGRINQAAESFSLAGWWTDPVWREDSGTLVVHLRLAASGWKPRQTASVRLWGETHALAAAPGETVSVALTRELAVGPVEATLRVSSPGLDESATSLPVRCGIGDLVLVEVQPRPADGEPEWFEILNRAPLPVDLDGWAVRDRGGTARLLTRGLVLEPGARVVFASDAQRLAGLYPSPAPFLDPSGGWPTLNDTDPGGGVAADSLHLLDPDGAVVDLVTWRRADIEERGRSLQRSRVEPGQVSLWLPSVDGSNPGSADGGEARHWPSGGMACSPDPFTPDGDGDRDLLEILLVRSRVRAIAVFDLQGDVVRELDVVRAGDRTLARWDGADARGRPVPAGAWVIVAETEDPPGVVRCVVGLGRGR